MTHLYVINTCFNFEGKIPNDSKVTAFTRNHTKDADETKTNFYVTPVRRHNKKNKLRLYLNSVFSVSFRYVRPSNHKCKFDLQM